MDIGCGTGAAARFAAAEVGPSGRVAGIDINPGMIEVAKSLPLAQGAAIEWYERSAYDLPLSKGSVEVAGMLAVAQRKAPQIEWRQGIAEDLPFDSSSFDAVVSQFGLMFFEDKTAALKEMVRVLRPSGRLALAVWDSLDHTPGYAAMVSLLQRLFGEQAANGLRPPFSLGNILELRTLCAGAGLSEAQITTHLGTARFPSLQAWVYTDIKGWVLADMLDEAQFELLLKEAAQALQTFVTADGTVSFASPAHIITFTKP